MRAVATYLETVSVPYTFCVVDNASTDGTREWLLHNVANFHLLERNRYPGYACNLGWSTAGEDVTHLHRADNDFEFLPGWCENVIKAFGKGRKVGQVGLRTGAEELWHHNNVGGNNIIRKELFDEGLRYVEAPWTDRSVFPAGWSEDSFFSPAVAEMGYAWKRVKKPCIRPISFESWDDPYYQSSWGDRSIPRVQKG
jgi:glycosyltransferase involved in cell wall biosynthesis